MEDYVIRIWIDSFGREVQTTLRSPNGHWVFQRLPPERAIQESIGEHTGWRTHTFTRGLVDVG